MIIGGLGIGAQEATLRRGSSVVFFFFKQKTAYEILGDWSSDVCSSDLPADMDTHVIEVRSGASFACVDLTADVEAFVRGRGDGLCNVFIPHATAGVALFELGSGKIGRASCRERV